MMIKNSLVSVLIGTYNRCELLQRCLDSIFLQTYKNIEVIVINDASLDSTENLLIQYKEQYNDRFKFHTNNSNKGIAYNSNLAFSFSSGFYLALIGDDDYWIDKDKITKQVSEFHNDTNNLGVVGSWWYEKNGKKMIEKNPNEPRNWKSRLLSGGGVICGSTPLIKRDAWNSVKGFDEKLLRGTDSDLFRRIILNGYNGKILQQYTTVVDVSHDNSRMTPVVSYQDANKMLKTNMYLLNKYKYFYLQHPKSMIKRIKSSLFAYIKTIIKYVT